MPTCRSCSAEIEWAEWASSGKPVPLDLGTVANGNLVVVNGKVSYYTAKDGALGRERRVAHFVTCPDARTWRQS